MPRIPAGCLAAVLALSLAARALAHPFQVSGFELTLRGPELSLRQDLDARTLVDVLQVDVNGDGSETADEIVAAKPQVVSYLDAQSSIERGGQRCTLGPPTRFMVGGGRLLLDRPGSCPRSGALRIDVTTFMEDAGGHRHVGVMHVDGVTSRHDFMAGATRFELGAPAARGAGGATAPTPHGSDGTSFAGWLGQGMRHVVLGPDHVLFVVGLVLGAKRARELLLVVTAFTLAHTLALALGVLEVVRVPARWVESAIALSVLWIATENALGTRPRARPALALGFGLVHGLAFGTALAALGAAGSGLALALAGFNVGVEFGQLAIVLPAFALLALVARQEMRARRVRVFVGGATALVAAIWLLERVAGLELIPG